MSKLLPGTCDLVLCFFYFKIRKTRENYFFKVIFFTKERNLDAINKR
jgi:hypothetical protein